MPSQEVRTTQQWAEVIHADLTRSVRGFIEAGQHLTAAKRQLPHGQWLSFIHRDLTIGERIVQSLMQIAANPALANEAHARSLPASWTTLRILSRLDEMELIRAIANGRVNPNMRQEDAQALADELSPDLPIPAGWDDDLAAAEAEAAEEPAADAEADGTGDDDDTSNEGEGNDNNDNSNDDGGSKEKPLRARVDDLAALLATLLDPNEDPRKIASRLLATQIEINGLEGLTEQATGELADEYRAQLRTALTRLVRFANQWTRRFSPGYIEEPEGGAATATPAA